MKSLIHENLLSSTAHNNKDLKKLTKVCKMEWNVSNSIYKIQLK